MTSDRFDPEPGGPRITCLDCGLAFTSDKEADAHRTESFELAKAATPQPDVRIRGHRTQNTNPSRASRIYSQVAGIVDDAIADAVDKVSDLVDAGHITAEEATEALSEFDGFADTWLQRDD